ncbi:MAG: type II secretion system F family protein [Anaerolineales bacterium]|nr:type II secretion system F family protein [Anaerolineales bacterium]MBS3751877.1 type II secretion system F family protein [Anaerolineales bacterium]
MSVLIWVGVLVVLIVSIALVVVGFRDRAEESPLEDRLAEYAARGEDVTLEEIELSQPITERVVIPLVRAIGEFTERFTPQKAYEQTKRKLELAGNPKGLDPTIFWASRFIAVVVVAGLLIMVFTFGTVEWTWGRKILLMAVFSAIGFFVPQLLLQSRINSRQDEIRKAMPDALDLLTICVQAGLGFDAAMQKVAEKWDDELADEFDQVLREIRLGKVRREALRNMDDRIGISEMTSFIAAIIQSEQLGVSMAKVLRIQSDQMRTKRRQTAEEKAQQAPVKMLFPMALLIFPSLLIILLGPAGLQLKNSALSGMFGG